MLYLALRWAMSKKEAFVSGEFQRLSLIFVPVMNSKNLESLAEEFLLSVNGYSCCFCPSHDSGCMVRGLPPVPIEKRSFA